mmetsp:Transcript_20453/g.57554  ORF Transcript_20453/g.57554 Transcript_20453/m.57554 type:complete len:296 (+) Transcript_20453:91-978(+)
MSAAAKDRRSNMVKSSINAPAKKDGAGGSYTWGSAMDVTDYEPVGLASMNQVVMVGPAPVPTPAPVRQESVCISDAAQFPSLGSQPAASPLTSARWAAPAPAVYQAPPVLQMAPAAAPAKVSAAAPVTKTYVVTQTAARTGPVQATSVRIPPPSSAGATVSTTVTTAGAPRVVLGEDMLRQGVPALDATHPRNAFARKPHHQPFAGATTVEQLQEAPAIDWTASGTTSFQQQVIHAVAQNPAHLGPYTEVKKGPSLDMLRAMPSPAAYIPNQKLSKQVAAQPKIAKPQVMFQRKC